MNRIIPTYELYGELLSGTLSDPVHHETIFERSSQLDWTIRLHRHSKMAQIFLFHSPDVTFQIGTVHHTSVEPMVLVIPPDTPHGFRFSEDVIGDVLTIPLGENSPDSLPRLIETARSHGGIMPHSALDLGANILSLLRQIKHTFGSVGSELPHLLRALTDAICMMLIQEMSHTTGIRQNANPTDMTRHEKQAQKFCELVESRFTQPDTIDDYAAAIGVSAPHLTRICKRILNKSPNDLIRQRRMLEAKRLLVYTRLPIHDIAHRAGFNEAGFFSRTFKSLHGTTPSEYRKTTD